MHRRLILVGKTITCSFSHELNRNSVIVFHGKAVRANTQFKSPNLSWQFVIPDL